MGQHRAQDDDQPSGFLAHWKQTEPVRLYLYGITVPLLAVAVVYGWLTTEQMGAWLAVAAALFVGSTLAGELARKRVASPAELRQVDRHAYCDGLEEGTRQAASLTVEKAHAVMAGQPATAAIPVGRCRRVESGDRCILPAHPDGVPHRFE